MIRMYRWQFHFNAMHNMFPQQEESKHAHSFLVILYIEKGVGEIWEQNQCEKDVKIFLSNFSGCYLNELEFFEGKIPTIEVICDALYPHIKEIAENYKMKLIRLEVGDSPTALCAVGEIEGK